MDEGINFSVDRHPRLNECRGSAASVRPDLLVYKADEPAAAPSALNSMSRNARSLFTESMNWMDDYYDPETGYLFDFSATTALNHDTRSSVWYALGLLARNKGDDGTEAEKIITNVIHAQYEEPKDEWYATYQKEPEEPYVGSPHYPAKIYNSWDPNWRGFVGTTLIMAMEEYSAIISKSTQKLILQSLYNTTKGDEYRFGNTDNTKDNLYPAYSNPSIMRAFVSGWTGRRLHEQNMTISGEKYAKDIINLFNRANTLSEFNSGTYTGVSLFGLLLWSKYLPEDSVMTKEAPSMIQHTWEAIGQLWHPGMKNIAGPWDRSYGRTRPSLARQPQIMSHMGDYAWGPLFAILADHHKRLIPNKVLSGLSSFSGEHTFQASAYYPPFDKVPRNITTWLSDKLTIGAESFDEIAIGGPSQNQEAFNPAVVQWDTGGEISFISLYPTETALQTKVGPGQLTLSYPNGHSGSIFSLLVGTFKSKRTISGWEDVVGLKVVVSGNVNMTHDLSFGGHYGGSDSPIRDFEFWNFTYSMPTGFVGTPTLTVDLEIS
ncbi:uncharacterized protein NECHADRAFT_97902 [Fusarium vanettenii 77-13-4]|uniref:Uncharacterized protein n=1 Tax=Fusarium vanettenii (strain ATCC MYA-4622 / CBS 123669 / FGSC 9596 / NRRL 45880 / 77-13-4) TaxID=660122 RepID=C7ZJY1_FUSV7|nr:uncharacterized protein NECHADRAFT_97902 [Fusarium vanettenii 77-13-4]EEU35671.1 hypothetical protein NECHADRAFT_97902 [Fusarium vanettenii 77-13-4]